MIELDNISKRYGNNEVLKNVTLSIDKGKLISFVGPNGAGKSTLLKIIAGMAPWMKELFIWLGPKSAIPSMS